MQAQESSFGELLLKMRGTYLKDSVETVSPESPLSIHNLDGLQTGLADSSDHFRIPKTKAQKPWIQALEITGKKRSLEKNWPNFGNVQIALVESGIWNISKRPPAKAVEFLPGDRN